MNLLGGIFLVTRATVLDGLVATAREKMPGSFMYFSNTEKNRK